MLKLVPKDSPQQIPPFEELFDSKPRAPFTCNVQTKGPNLFTMSVQDPSHFLECDLTLEVEKSQDENESITVICHFPKICDEILNVFVWEDHTLYAIVMIQFQLKILKHLLLFCASHYAANLIIYSDDEQAEDLEIYRDFLIYEDPNFLSDGEMTEMNIPANLKAYEVFVEFMDQLTLKFLQALWQDQRVNPAFHRYLKYHPFGENY